VERAPVITAAPLVVVPALNEEETVREVVLSVRLLDYPVCVIDDASADSTALAARSAGATVLSLPVHLGVGGALRCGFRYAIASGYNTVVQIDGDGQHDAAEIPALLSALTRTGADMVIGSRFITPRSEYPVSAARRAMIRFLAHRASRAAGVQITDSTSGFRAIRRPLLDCFAEDYPTEYLGDTFEALASAGRLGARVAEHPIHASPRVHGRASAGVVASLWYLVRVVIASEIIRPRTPRASLHTVEPFDD
jgi:glycosyltransferase involved in cell wall biosynthesis